jgi:enediyne biosynthesis protein E4
MTEIKLYQNKFLIIFISVAIFILSCTNKKAETKPFLFEALENIQTGLNFSNKLTARADFNMFKYMYFYNGAGVATGDFNNDGLTDLFFTSNQSKNKLFLNKGSLKFEDVTTPAKIPNDSAWSTGVSVVDINNDGLLDMYVCRVGNYESLQSHNQFLICKGIDKTGIPFYEDEAKQMGLAKSAFSTQAAFIDYDMDGDLDMYLMNHSLRYNGTFNDKKTYENTRDSLAGDILFKNDKGKFIDVSKQAGISGSIISYGLGICVADINMDGWPDIYIGNDFHENDYLYINQKNGTFKETLQEQTMHTSQFSMGVDVADINNDAAPEIISMDMLPYDPKILKRSFEDDDYNLFNYKVKAGYHPQFSRNALQLNDGRGMFKEAAMYAGVEATDWSWAALWTDFDNDGWKDLFVSNGIPKRLNDMDYVNYVTNTDIQDKIRSNKMDEKEMALINKFPEIKLPNKFFLNKHDAKFEDIEAQIKNDKPTFSNGAVYADFDNDGDVDVVVNNIEDPVLLYENKTSKTDSNKWIELKLKGDLQNVNAIGTKAIIFSKNEIRTYEKYPVRGFQSSMEVPLHIGLGNVAIDSILLVWPDNTCEKINYQTDSIQAITYKKGLPTFDYKIATEFNATQNIAKDITAETGLLFKHEENNFNEFDREGLMTFMVSREGPALAVGDVNGDGLDDVYVGSAKFIKPILFFQNASGKFIKFSQPALDNDSTYEDVDANFADVNNDGFKDLLVASGGNEFYGNSEILLPRIYLNDGKGNFTRKKDAFDAKLQLTASCIKPYDFNGDGFVDLFIGGRAIPWEYSKTPTSYLLQNDGTGKFIDVTNKYNTDLAKIGLVTNATWADLDKDGKKDLLVSLEWGGIVAFKNNTTSFEKKVLTDKLGWWNFVFPLDINGDGNEDLIAGNLGENNRFHANEQQPVSLYYNDFDDNGKKEQFLTYFLMGREIPFADKDELTKQMPALKKKFLYAEDFTNSQLKNIVGADKMAEAEKLQANYFSNAFLINKGNWNFSVQAFPWQAQLSCYKTAAVINYTKDSLPNILLGGNFYHSNIRLGKYDADYGTVLSNKGKGNFAAENITDIIIKGEVRHILPITIKGEKAFVLVKNNDSLVVLKFKN